MDVATKGLIRDLRPGLQEFLRADPGRATVLLLETVAMVVAVVALGAWGASLGGAGYALLVLAMLLMGPVMHRISVLNHEAIHGLIHPNPRINDPIMYLLATSVGALPETTRRGHLSHHAHLGDARDQEGIGYDSPPRNRNEFVRWVLLRLSGLQTFGRFLELLTATLLRRGAAPAAAAEGGRAKAPAFVTPLSDWVALAAMQLVLLGLFAATVGWAYYFLLWLFPLFSGLRTVSGVRAFVEHLREKGEAPGEGGDPGRGLLLTFDSGPVERFVLGPLFFHLHAEHHLFPTVPSWRLPEVRDRIRAHPQFGALVRRYPSYRAALKAHLAA